MVYGAALAAVDQHLVDAIVDSKITRLYYGIYSAPGTYDFEYKKRTIELLPLLRKEKHGRGDLTVTVFTTHTEK